MKVLKMAALGFLMLSTIYGGTLAVVFANRLFGEGLDLIVSAVLFVAILIGMLALDDLSAHWGMRGSRVHRRLED